MLILLPPSEGKTQRRRGRPLDLETLSFPELTGLRSRVIEGAREVVLLQKKPVKDSNDVRRAMGQRDAWITRNADAAIVVWDGKDQLLGKQVKALEKQVGDEVWIVDPADLT